LKKGHEIFLSIPDEEKKPFFSIHKPFIDSIRNIRHLSSIGPSHFNALLYAVSLSSCILPQLLFFSFGMKKIDKNEEEKKSAECGNVIDLFLWNKKQNFFLFVYFSIQMNIWAYVECLYTLNWYEIKVKFQYFFLFRRIINGGKYAE